MKRFLILLVIAVLLTGSLFAQNRGNPPPPDVNRVPVTITGTLQLERGQIAIKSGDSVYFVPRLMPLAGFIEGIKEGNTITITGFQRENFIRPTSMTVDGKTYDLPIMNQNQPNQQNFRQNPQHRHPKNRQVQPDCRQNQGEPRNRAARQRGTRRCNCRTR